MTDQAALSAPKAKRRVFTPMCFVGLPRVCCHPAAQEGQFSIKETIMHHIRAPQAIVAMCRKEPHRMQRMLATKRGIAARSTSLRRRSAV